MCVRSKIAVSLVAGLLVGAASGYFAPRRVATYQFVPVKSYDRELLIRGNVLTGQAWYWKYPDDDWYPIDYGALAN